MMSVLILSTAVCCLSFASAAANEGSEAILPKVPLIFLVISPSVNLCENSVFDEIHNAQIRVEKVTSNETKLISHR